MLVPSLSCQARCGYCFGPHEGGPTMSPELLDAAVDWVLASYATQGAAPHLADPGARPKPDHPVLAPLEVLFHGGEPLSAGIAFYRHALPRLRASRLGRRLRIGIQSNLWLLTDEVCDLLAEHGVSVGTSLDGPAAVTDAQRGEGYFRRTMEGIERARRRGLRVGCVCTFTRLSAPRADEVFDFFVREGLDFTIHAAVSSLPPADAAEGVCREPGGHRLGGAQRAAGGAPDVWSLSPAEHGDLLVRLLDRYLENLGRVRISTLDALCRAVSSRQGGICLFGDCLGDYLAVGPDGAITPCQRFAGRPEFSLGRVQDCPGPEELAQSPAWRRIREREERIAEECGDCPHFDYCKGGCPYDALAAGGGSAGALRDPYCPAYRRIFDHITDRALAEVFSDENLAQVVAQPDEGTLLHRGRLLGLMRGDPHPRDAAARACRVLAAVALAGSEIPAAGAQRLAVAGVAGSEQRAHGLLAAMATELSSPRLLNNLYLHVTFGCNLRCAHCYAAAGPDRMGSDVLSVRAVGSLCRQAAGLGFRQVVVTGGEPLFHPDADDLLQCLAHLRSEVKPLETVLRTNLALDMDARALSAVGNSTDKVFVSIDGSPESHDARRGAGSYARTAANLRALVQDGGSAELALTAILSAEEACGPPGDSVRSLARDLGIRRVHFRPLLPLGRALGREVEIVREAHWSYLGADEVVAFGMQPAASCGIGQSLYVEPSGAAFPCYACAGERWLLGNVCAEGGLARVVGSSQFRSLAERTVDSNRQCRICALRYLCGGACRAWRGQGDPDLDAPPVDCGPLHSRARSLVLAALAHLGVAIDAWVRAGLPLPEEPPVTPA